MDVTEEDVQQYIDELAWSSSATKKEKTLVACNLKSFYTWLTLKNSEITTVSGVIEGELV